MVLIASALLGATVQPKSDCADCPAWVAVPAGEFIMGSSDTETEAAGVSESFARRERPQRRIALKADFGLGVYPVSRGEFRRYVEATGHAPEIGCTVFDSEQGSFVVDPSLSWTDPGFPQDDTHPVVCVSRDDSLRYLDWLAKTTDASYRLPSEAEWEYAARAGTQTAQPWEGGLAAACEHANAADRSRLNEPHLPPLLNCDDGWPFTSPVGAFPANAYGVADQIGNVREWVADCFSETLSPLPSDGKPYLRDDCPQHSLRGVSFDYPVNQLRAAVRYRYPADVRYPNVGFRVARDIVNPTASAAKAEVLPEGDTGRADARGPVIAQNHLVVVANPLAADAADEILSEGGSAVDALIAAQLVLNIVEPQSSGLGGGGFALHWDAQDSRLVTYDGRETAPMAAPEDLFLDETGKPISFAESIAGGRSVAVPAMARLLEAMHRDSGRLPWSRLFEPAIRIAEEGFEVSPRMAQLIGMTETSLRRHPSTRSYFFDENGDPLQAGHWLRSPQMAETLHLLASQGSDAIYTGLLAEQIVETVRGDPDLPGTLTLEDMSEYRVVKREAVCGPYRNYRVCGMGPPSSGGLTVGQILGILQHFDLAGAGKNSPLAEHLFIEASRLAFADRAIYIADPDFAVVPGTGLIDPAYLTFRAQLIDPQSAAREVRHGNPPWHTAEAVDYAEDRSAGIPGTTHLSIVDRHGNAVSMTSTIQAGFGARIMTGGMLLNNEMSNFSFVPREGGRPVANRIEGGKRPLSAMAPTMVFDADDVLKLITGSPGGPAIIPYVVRSIIAALDWGLDAQASVTMPHVVTIGSNPFFGDIVFLERGTTAEEIAEALEALGHQVRLQDTNSGTHMIRITQGRMEGGADPRREGVALGH